MTAPTILTPGTVFARDFGVVKALRQGGMGAVYVVRQLSTGRHRALKLMAPELVHNPEVRARFEREAKIAANIESDHVVETVTAGVDDATGAPYLVMELLRGEELGDVITRMGRIGLGDLVEIYTQIGHALEQAHAKGVVHRDLKPENIFLAISKRRDVPYTAKILDFGIAKLVAEGMQKTGTQPLGTPYFMSPEQTHRTGRIGPQTDVWALGLIAFFLLTGRWFWREAEHGNLPSLLREVCIEPIGTPSARAAELNLAHVLPQGFDAWFARCVDRDIDKRFADAGAAVRALEAMVAGMSLPRAIKIQASATDASGMGDMGFTESFTSAHTAPALATAAAPIAPVPVAPPPQRGRGLVLAVVGVTFLAGAAVAFVFLARGPRSPASAASSKSGEATSSQAPVSASVAAPASSSATAAPENSGCPEGMVMHPPGKTFMGSRSLPPEAGANVDGRKVTLSGFCLDRTEVTVDAYEKCIEDGTCERTPDDVNFAGITPEKKKVFTPFCNARKPDRGKHPINCVSFKMAAAFCKWRGARLPTEAEWEYAARGKTQRDYPWGNEAPDKTRLNAAGTEYDKWATEAKLHGGTMYAEDDGFIGTAPVGSFPAGASSYGVEDLAGNVWEWVADAYAPYAAGEFTDPKGPDASTAEPAPNAERVIRGGAFNGSDPTWANPAWRYKSTPDTYNHAIGFRCAASPK